MLNKNKLSGIDELRREEGLGKTSHQTLEDILRRIENKEGPFMTLAQASINVE